MHTFGIADMLQEKIEGQSSKDIGMKNQASTASSSLYGLEGDCTAIFR
jgi:hypothetical protein